MDNSPSSVFVSELIDECRAGYEYSVAICPIAFRGSLGDDDCVAWSRGLVISLSHDHLELDGLYSVRDTVDRNSKDMVQREDARGWKL